CPGLLEDSRRTHVGRNIATAMRGAEYRQPVERRRIDIVGISGVQLRHGSFEALIARCFRPLAVEGLDRVEIRLFALGLRLRAAGGGCRGETVQGGPGNGTITV